LFNKIGKWFVILIAVVVLAMGYLLYSQHNEISRLKIAVEKANGYAGGKLLPEDVMSDIEVLKNSITEMRRLGPDTVIVVEHYLPAESEVHYTSELDETAWQQMQDIMAQLTVLQMSGDTTGLAALRVEIDKLKYSMYTTTVEYSNYGLVIRPAIGIGINGSLDEEIVLGARLFYYNRYGLGVHGTISDFSDVELGTGLFIDARLPYFNNVGGYIGEGYNWTTKEWNTRIGLQGYLN
jgi:hypothetical protein